jgi:hypothetical protein
LIEFPKPGAPHPVASSTSKAQRAFVFLAYGRKSKPPAMRVVVDANDGFSKKPLQFRAVIYLKPLMRSKFQFANIVVPKRGPEKF